MTAAATLPVQRSRVLTAVRSRENSLLVVLVVFSLAMGLLRPAFLSWDNLTLILATCVVLCFVALGEFLVVVTGAVDISVGAIVGISAVAISVTLGAGLSVWLAIAISVAAAALAGLVNGLLVAVAGIPSVVVTLATLSIFRWSLEQFTGGDSSSAARNELSWLTNPGVLGLPLSVFAAGLAAIVVAGFARRTQVGRDIFAVGANETAASVSGVSVRRARIVTFVLAAVLAGIAGIFAASQLAYVSAQTGNGLEFLAIGAVVLGGTNLFGGSGHVRGVVTGVLLLYAIYDAMVLLAVPAAWQDAVAGALILAAVVIDTAGRQRGRG
jgi:AI-2 transport system permease protein